MKVCNKCHRELPATTEYFHRDARAKDGLVKYCKECKHKNYIENREKQIQQAMDRYHADRENKMRQMRVWYRKNREQEIEKQIERNNQNIERNRENHRRYMRNNPDKRRFYSLRRYREKSFKISNSDWEYCKSYFDHSCAYCGIAENESIDTFGESLHKEHVINDGRNDLKNCVPACKACNSHKHKKAFNDWYNADNPVYSIKRYMKIYQWLRFGCRKIS